MFLTPIHPLVRQAAAEFETNDPMMTGFYVTDDVIPPGDYPFAIYQWRFSGIRDDLILQAVCKNTDITGRFFQLMKKSQPLNLAHDDMPGQEIFDSLDSVHYQLWSDAKKDHIARTRQIAEYRRESLTTSHKARLNLLVWALTPILEEPGQVKFMEMGKRLCAERGIRWS